MQLPDLKGVRNASENLQGVSVLTPLVINERLSNDLNCKIYLKREDLQQVRSFKIRGAFNKIRSIDSDYLKNKTLVLKPLKENDSDQKILSIEDAKKFISSLN